VLIPYGARCGGPNAAPAWSSDGRRLAFSGISCPFTSPGQFDLLVGDATGGNVRTASALDGNEIAFDWSPNDRRIAFSTCPNAFAACFLATIGPGGTGLRQLTSADVLFGYVKSASWSPDGSSILFIDRLSGNSGPGSLFVINADGSGLRQIPGSYYSRADWSPDGSQIVADTYSPRSVVVIRPDGSLVARVATRATGPVWSPDGSRVAFTRSSRTDPSMQTIVTARPDGTGLKKLVQLPQPAFSIQLSWQPLLPPA
jgi:Tol biopolymer transport system component